MTLKEAISALEAAGVPNPRLDARLIFSEIGRVPRHLLVFADTECSSFEVTEAINRRANREPLQYIIGEVGFYRERYKVCADCLIPREDTEILVELATKNIPRGARFLDLCTGSGCVAISVLKNTEDTTSLGIDISAPALSLARENARLNGVDSRLDLLRLDVLNSVAEGEFFAVLSNPPYVRENTYGELEPEIYFEPREAFVGGEDGLDFYRAITKGYKNSITDGGFLAFEIGFDQGDALRKIAEENSMSAEIITDLSGKDRVALLRKH